MAIRKYREAGEFFKQLRRSCGIMTRDDFIFRCQTAVGPTFSYAQIVNLEIGRKEPTISHFLAYQAVTQCESDLIKDIPGL